MTAIVHSIAVFHFQPGVGAEVSGDTLTKLRNLYGSMPVPGQLWSRLLTRTDEFHQDFISPVNSPAYTRRLSLATGRAFAAKRQREASMPKLWVL